MVTLKMLPEAVLRAWPVHSISCFDDLGDRDVGKDNIKKEDEEKGILWTVLIMLASVWYDWLDIDGIIPIVL